MCNSRLRCSSSTLPAEASMFDDHPQNEGLRVGHRRHVTSSLIKGKRRLVGIIVRYYARNGWLTSTQVSLTLDDLVLNQRCLMAGSRQPGPLCQWSRPQQVEDGTMSRT